MSFLSIRRRKLTCFYCTHQVLTGNLPVGTIQNYPNGRPRRFTCPNCSADNHLDESGDILDYIPDTPAQPAPVFARRRNSPRAIHSLTQRANTPDSPPPTQTFCRTCAHNQKFITDAVAAYPLPPEDHPDYDEHINVLFPKHRRLLEVRWPPVCADCAPKVNERIRTSNYQVKVASLGQMLARSSGYEAAAVGGGKRDKRDSSAKKKFENVVWWVRGGVWCYFHFLMLVWHGSAVLHPDQAQDMEGGVASWGSCIVRSVVAGEVDLHCYGVSAEQAARLTPWSILGFFWIYRERSLQSNPHKKLVGAREYLKLELAIYVFRVLCWYFVAPGGISLDEDAFSRVHLGLFFMSLMSTLFSITCLKLEDPPSFSLREPEPIPGTPSPPASPPPRHAPVARHPMSPITPLRPSITKPPPSTGGSTFYSPVKRVRAASPTPAPRRGTPAKEALSPDAMDWNPTDSQETTARWQSQTQRLPPPPQPSFTPSFNNAQVQRQNQYVRSASPFSGTLPPAPRAPAQRLVSSILHQPQKQTPSTQLAREQFFTHRVNPASSAPAGAEFSKVSAIGYRLGSPQYPPMAPQRFFVDDEATGLETLMAGGFKLEDEPEIVSEKLAEESWAYVGMRVISLLGCIAGIVWFASVGRLAIQICVSTTLVLVCWREGLMTPSASASASASSSPAARGNAIMFKLLEPGFLMVLLLVALFQRDNSAYESQLRRAGLVGVIGTLIREFWGMLMRMQRSRARKFYEDERKRSIEEEKEGRRREREESADSGRSRGSAPSLRREGSNRSSFGGLSLS